MFKIFKKIGENTKTKYKNKLVSKAIDDMLSEITKFFNEGDDSQNNYRKELLSDIMSGDEELGLYLTTDVKVGTILIAKDTCPMRDTNIPTLTIGKEYKVFEIEGGEFAIVDDEDDDHYFSFRENSPDHYGIFFDIKG